MPKQPKPPSSYEQYKTLIRTPVAVLTADGTLVLLALSIMAVVYLACQGFLAMGMSPGVIGFVETATSYSSVVVILIFVFDTPIKILTFSWHDRPK